MKTIPLARSTRVAVVDDWHHGWLSQHTWNELRRPGSNRSSYAFRRAKTPEGKSTIILMHREIMGLENGDPREVDHRDHDGLNNLEQNLRIVTPLENAANRPLSRKSRTGHKGVMPYQGRFQAQIKRLGVPFALGTYDHALEAATAYNAASLILFGDHAAPNPVPPDEITPERLEEIRQAVIARVEAKLRRSTTHPGRPGHRYRTCFDAGRNRHRAQALLDGCWTHIGCYRTKEEAVYAARLAADPASPPDPAIDPQKLAAIRKRVESLLALPT